MRRYLVMIMTTVVCVVGGEAQFVATQSRSLNEGKIVELSNEVYYQLDSVYTYNNSGNIWVLESRKKNSYNNSRDIAHTILQFRQGEEWSNIREERYSYSDGNTIWNKESLKWNSENSQWQPVWKKRFTNDESGNTIKIEYSEMLSEEWNNVWQQTQAYNSNGDLASYQTVKWNEERKNYEHYWNYNCLYSQSGNISQIINESFDTESSEWNNEWQCTYDYNASGELLNHQIIDWDDEKKQWDNVRLTTVDDVASNEEIHIREEWDETAEEWAVNGRQIKKFDTRGNLIELRSEYWINNDWQSHRVDTYVYNDQDVKTEEATFYWNSENANWENHLKSVYFYSEKNRQATEIPDGDDGKVLIVYPSPAIDNISLKYNVEATGFKIYSVTGELVRVLDVPKVAEVVSVKGLKNGVYIAVLESEEGNLMTKFIKK